MNNDIDIVLPWVNPADINWLKNYKNTVKSLTGDKTPRTIRDMGTLKFIFRGIEKNAPWVRKIHLLLYSPTQIPEWLNVNHPKLSIHYHKDFIPEQFTPTYNNLVIEMFIHKLPDLAEKFILINDDMYFVKPLVEEDFFIDNLPTDYPKKTNVIASNPANDRELKAMRLNYKTQKLSFFNHIVKNSLNCAKIVTNKYNLWYNYHQPLNINLSSMIKYYTELEKQLLASCKNSKIRTTKSIVSWFYRYIRLNKNEYIQTDFLEKNFAFIEVISPNVSQVFKHILTKKIVVINDRIDNSKDFPIVKKRLHKIFNAVFPQKSEFENE